VCIQFKSGILIFGSLNWNLICNMTT